MAKGIQEQALKLEVLNNEYSGLRVRGTNTPALLSAPAPQIA